MILPEYNPIPFEARFSPFRFPCPENRKPGPSLARSGCARYCSSGLERSPNLEYFIGILDFWGLDEKSPTSGGGLPLGEVVG